MRQRVLVVAAACLALGACHKRVERAPKPKPESPAIADDPIMRLVRDNQHGGRPRGMANCPSLVPGASTTVTDRPDGVTLTVTSKAPGADERIRRLARFHAAFAPAPHRRPPEHSARGTGGGSLGHCPIVHVDTVVRSEAVAGGARITVTARDPRNVVAIQHATHARAASLAGGRAS